MLRRFIALPTSSAVAAAAAPAALSFAARLKRTKAASAAGAKGEDTGYHFTTHYHSTSYKLNADGTWSSSTVKLQNKDGKSAKSSSSAQGTFKRDGDDVVFKVTKSESKHSDPKAPQLADAKTKEFRRPASSFSVWSNPFQAIWGPSETSAKQIGSGKAQRK